MPRNRRRATVVVALVLVVGAAWYRAYHRPGGDTEGFQGYVYKYIAGWSSGDMHGVPRRDQRWAIAHPKVIVREGDRACTWLSQRPSAPDVDPTGATGADRLRRLYVADTAGEPIAQVAAFSRERIVTATWNFLCPDQYRDKTSSYTADEGDD